MLSASERGRSDTVRRVCAAVRLCDDGGCFAGIVEPAVMELAIVRRWVGCRSLEVIRWASAWGRM